MIYCVCRGSAIKVKEELDKLLAYNQALTDLRNNADKEKLPPGIGSVSVLGRPILIGSLRTQWFGFEMSTFRLGV
jgi:hypothetical protein